LKKVFVHIAILFLSTLSVVGQTEEADAVLELAYFDDFGRYRSSPSMSVDRVFEDSRGKLWLQTCGTAKQLSAHLFNFDGYTFKLAEGKLSEIGKDFHLTTVISDTLFGYEQEGNVCRFFTFDLLSQSYNVYDSIVGVRFMEQFWIDNRLITSYQVKDSHYVRVRTEGATKTYPIPGTCTCIDEQEDFDLRLTFYKNDLWK
jgi:hypothetical protein